MTRSSRPSFPPQILLRQSRARSLALFSDLTFAPISRPQRHRRHREGKTEGKRDGRIAEPLFLYLLSLRLCVCGGSVAIHSGDSSERLSQYCCSASLMSERRTIFSKSTSSSGKGASRKAAAC